MLEGGGSSETSNKLGMRGCLSEVYVPFYYNVQEHSASSQSQHHIQDRWPLIFRVSDPALICRTWQNELKTQNIWVKKGGLHVLGFLPRRGGGGSSPRRSPSFHMLTVTLPVERSRPGPLFALRLIRRGPQAAKA